MPNDMAATRQQLLPLLEELLDLGVWDAREVMTAAAGRVARWMQCDKADAFLFDASRGALVAIGTSDTPLGQLEKQLGLDVLPLAEAGRIAEVYQTGRSYVTGHADRDPLCARH